MKAILRRAMPCFHKRQRVDSPPTSPEVRSPAKEVPDVVSSGGDDEPSIEDNEDNGTGVDWQAEGETDRAAAEEFARRIAAIHMAAPGGTFKL